MRRRPEQVDQLFLDAGETGLTVGARVLDNEGATTIARTTGFVEFPTGSGLYYLDPFTFPADRGSYTVLFDWDGGTAAPGFTATEELEITSSTGEAFDGETYGTTDELFRILKIRTPTAEQEDAGERVLTVATWEINQECDLEESDVLSGAQIAVATEVAYERAAELWAMQEVRFNVLSGDMGGITLARDSWAKYAIRLWTLKQQWGFA
jgi:hypothetical protein